MASNASISGLGSGLDTATIISQLMQLEAVPQSRLKNRVTSEQGMVTTLRTLNTKVAMLGSRAEDLSKPSVWTPVAATSSNTAVSVTAGSTAAASRLTVTVTDVALTHQLVYANPAATTDVVTGATTKVKLDRFDGSPVLVDTTDGTLQGLVNAINDPANKTGLQATTVNTAGGYRLLVESVETGVAQDFDITAEDGSALLGGHAVRAGKDAAIRLGDDPAISIPVTSVSNTFTDLQPGLSLTLAPDAKGQVATISVSRDGAKVSSAVSSFVDAVNGLLSDIDAQTGYDPATGQGGPLLGDPNIRWLRGELLDAVYPADGTSPSVIGIAVDRQGRLTFDPAKFAAAYAADPEGVAERFTDSVDGIARKVAVVADGASDPITGTITAAITGRNSAIKRMQDSIDDWDRRLELRRETLTRQFTALETALNQMTSQSNWLAGQLASLPGNSAG